MTLVFLVALVAWMPLMAMAHDGAHETTSTATPEGLPAPAPSIPPDAVPPGERNPWIALVAAGAIVVAGVAGISIYRTIKEGL